MDCPVKTLAFTVLYAWWLVIAQVVDAQELQSMSMSWTEVVDAEDGTPIESYDLIYVVINKAIMLEICVTSDTTCTFPVHTGECGSLYAVARQISTGLESRPSNVIDVCVDDLSARLNTPLLIVDVM